MKRILILAGLLLCAASPKPAERFRYAGYSRDTDLSQLRAKLPNSKHDGGPFSYYVWVSPKDVGPSRLYYLNFRKDRQGRIESVHLSFEIPQDLRKRVRTPRCSVVEASLVTQYGPVMEIEPPWYEEALLHEPKFWFSDTEELKWDCGEASIVIQPRPAAQYRGTRIRPRR